VLSLSVVNVAVLPKLVSVKLTLGMTAPELSATVPTIEPLVKAWPHANEQVKRSRTVARINWRNLDVRM